MDLRQDLKQMINAGDFQFCHIGSCWIYQIQPHSRNIRISVSTVEQLDEAVLYYNKRELKMYTDEDYIRLFQRLKKRSDKLCRLRKHLLIQNTR